MKFVFMCLLFLCLFLSAAAQQRVISGQLHQTDGSPLPGVNIIVKNTNRGTTTDIDGNYRITAQPGDVLVFSFIGFDTREVKVTNTGLLALSPNHKPTRIKTSTPKTIEIPLVTSFYDLADTLPGPHAAGRAILSDSTPTYLGATANIQNIHRVSKHLYSLKAYNQWSRRTGVHVQYSTSVGLETVYQLPALQDQYAQGRPVAGQLAWRGADQQEIFSWGPALSSLEYEGTDYPYDVRGRLVPTGTGTGETAEPYRSQSLFRTGVTATHELITTLPVGHHHGTFLIDAVHKDRTGIIPHTHYQQWQCNSALKNLTLWETLRVQATTLYQHAQGQLLTRGANMATLMGSLYRTPASFDNTQAYQLEDGSPRSHAPYLVDNPYGLVHTLPDHESLNRFFGALALSWRRGRFAIDGHANTQQQWGRHVYGLPADAAGAADGRLTQRKDQQHDLNGTLKVNYQLPGYGMRSGNISLSYTACHTRRSVHRYDAFHFNTAAPLQRTQADSLVSYRHQQYRNHQEIVLDASYTYRWLTLTGMNRSYFSNTLPAHVSSLFLPAGKIKVDIRALVGPLQYFNALSKLLWYGATAHTLQEAPLLYAHNGYATATGSVSNYAAYYEATELFFTPVKPAIETSFETGLRSAWLYERLSVGATWHTARTEHFIAPLHTHTGYGLQNAATVVTKGGLVTIEWFSHIMGDIAWDTQLSWSHQTARATAVHTTTEHTPLAGFTTVQTQLAAGQPVGALYGTTYQKDAQGRTLIGNDGFPIEDPTLRRIGNPTPQWTLGWSSTATWRDFSLSWVFDYRHGGQVWNGTQAMLDYLGRSAKTARQRNITDYVFKGVTADGETNTTAVAFADPTQPLSANRWVRYGPDGVGKAYVEDASCLRLNEVTLSYSYHRYHHARSLKNMTIACTAHNLWMSTRYRGVDPASTLFGYSAGTGMDLFNLPGVRSYRLQLTVTF